MFQFLFSKRTFSHIWYSLFCQASYIRKSWKTLKKAYNQVSGISPILTNNGKLEIDKIVKIY